MRVANFGPIDIKENINGRSLPVSLSLRFYPSSNSLVIVKNSECKDRVIMIFSSAESEAVVELMNQWQEKFRSEL